MVVLLLLIALVAIVVRGVRVRIHDGGGREAGVCVRRVSLRRTIDGVEEPTSIR